MVFVFKFVAVVMVVLVVVAGVVEGAVWNACFGPSITCSVFAQAQPLCNAGGIGSFDITSATADNAIVPLNVGPGLQLCPGFGSSNLVFYIGSYNDTCGSGPTALYGCSDFSSNACPETGADNSTIPAGYDTNLCFHCVATPTPTTTTTTSTTTTTTTTTSSLSTGDTTNGHAAASSGAGRVVSMVM